MTARDICQSALLEINVNDPVDDPAQSDVNFVLTKLNRLLDDWNADRNAVYADQFLERTITAGLNPHTIGPSGATWTATTNRPVSIEGAILILTGSTPEARVPMTKRDAQWFQNLPVPTLESQIPTDFFYNPTWPNGSFYMWPVPSQAYDVQLWCRVVLAQLGLNDTFTLPPGYWDAITLTLAEDISEPFQKPVTGSLSDRARRARARIFGNNITIPRLATRDAGMQGPRSGDGLPDFNWYDGSIVR